MLKRMKSYLLVPLAILCISMYASANLMIMEYGSAVNNIDQTVTFFINFNEVPDFYTVDEFSRQADEFQFYIDTDASALIVPQQNYETIVRGGEINIEGDIRIRENLNSPDYVEPFSGGWGPILNTVPYTLSETLISFTTSLSSLKDDDGTFTYQLLLCKYGSSTDDFYGYSGENYCRSGNEPSQVPEPSTILLLSCGLIVLAGFHEIFSKKAKHIKI